MLGRKWVQEIENGRQGPDTQPCLLRRCFQGPAWSLHSSTWGLVCLSNKLIWPEQGCLPQLCPTISSSVPNRLWGGWGLKGRPKSILDQRGQVTWSWSPKQHRVSKGKQPSDDPSQCCLPWLAPSRGGSEEGITQAPKTNLLSPQSPKRKMTGWMGKFLLPPKPLAFSARVVSGQAPLVRL